jgi:transcriptional regulator with XRE-family HTH domain
VVAERVGIGRVAVADIEAGRRRLCVQEAVRLAQALRVSLAELLDMPCGDAVSPQIRRLVAGLDERQVEQLAVFAEFLRWRGGRGGETQARAGEPGVRGGARMPRLMSVSMTEDAVRRRQDGHAPQGLVLPAAGRADHVVPQGYGPPW